MDDFSGGFFHACSFSANIYDVPNHFLLPSFSLLLKDLPDNIQMPLEKIFGGKLLNEGGERDVSLNPIKKYQTRMRTFVQELIKLGHYKLEESCIDDYQETLKLKLSKYISL